MSCGDNRRPLSVRTLPSNFSVKNSVFCESSFDFASGHTLRKSSNKRESTSLEGSNALVRSAIMRFASIDRSGTDDANDIFPAEGAEAGGRYAGDEDVEVIGACILGVSRSVRLL